jgi:Flp pilus assembly protein TadG
MAILRQRLKALRDDTGAEVIELALVLPILLLVLAGIVDFGFLFQRFEVVTNAAREGARVAVLPGYSQADVQARVQSYLTKSGLSGAMDFHLEYTTEQLGGVAVRMAKVTVGYPNSFLVLGPFVALVRGQSFGALNLNAVSVMRVEAPSGL